MRGKDQSSEADSNWERKFEHCTNRLSRSRVQTLMEINCVDCNEKMTIAATSNRGILAECFVEVQLCIDIFDLYPSNCFECGLIRENADGY